MFYGQPGQPEQALTECYDGHIAQHLGDGLMVYFGWSQAHKDDCCQRRQRSVDLDLRWDRLQWAFAGYRPSGTTWRSALDVV
jgi:hypothetical protein